MEAGTVSWVNLEWRMSGMMVLNTKLESTRGCWFLGNWDYCALELLKQEGTSHSCSDLLKIWVKMGGGALCPLKIAG